MVPSGMVTSFIKRAASHRTTGTGVEMGVSVKNGEGTLLGVCNGVEVSSTALTVWATEVL